jgi:hypothetical protein
LGHALARIAPEAFELLYGLPGQDTGSPRPFVLLPDLAGAAAAPLGFSLTLLGAASFLAPVLVLAAENLAATGLGNRNIPLRLLRVVSTRVAAGGRVSSELLGSDAPWRGDADAPCSLSALAAAWAGAPAGRVLIRFDTRLRLKAANGVLKQTPACEVLVQRLLERVSALAALYGAGPLPGDGVRALLALARGVALESSTLRWTEWSRTSGRTGQVMPWGGLLGEVAYQGELAALMPWLALGEWLHVGSKTSFGLGHYRLWSAP